MKDKEEKNKEKILNRYNIDIVALQNKAYDYNFVCDKDFFACFDNSLFETGHCEVKLDFVKSETMITVVFHIKGNVELVCDRSLEVFDYPIDSETKIFFKYGEKAEELSDDVVVIARTTATLKLADYIQELVNLEVPMKKLHPRFLNEDEDETEGELLIYSSTTGEADTAASEEPEPIDPRWANLKKLL
jgi:uncharacterized protein